VRSVLLLQSSGVGNCINMLALATVSRFPLLLLVTMARRVAEFNPWQVPMGQATEPALNAIGVRTFRADTPSDLLEITASAATLAFRVRPAGRRAAVPAHARREEMVSTMAKQLQAALDRREAVAALLKDRGDLLVVTGLGSPSYDVHAAGDTDANYYLWGAMGAAALVGLASRRPGPIATSWSSPAMGSS